MVILIFLFCVSVNGAVISIINDSNVEVISLNESQHFFVNQNTIRFSDNFTSELQVINKTEHVIISTTTINSAVVFIAPSNGTRCSPAGISKGLFIILLVIFITTIMVAIINIILHLVFKELHTMAGVWSCCFAVL